MQHCISSNPQPSPSLIRTYLFIYTRQIQNAEPLGLSGMKLALKQMQQGLSGFHSVPLPGFGIAGGQLRNADSSGIYGRNEREGVGDEGDWVRSGSACRRTRDMRGEENAID
jgi:hypothetical protein